jgi:NADH-quinone oxidoreductase subunit C
MSQALEQVAEEISARFAEKVVRVPSRCAELTFEVRAATIVEVCKALRDEPNWRFEQLIDLAGVDYMEYGRSEWNTQSATWAGFSRGVDRGVESRASGEARVGLDSNVRGAGEVQAPGTLTGAAATAGPDVLDEATAGPAGELSLESVRGEARFAVVYHLLSVTHNRRVRLRAWCEPGEPPMIDSVIDVWKSADWFEREAFDLYGVLFRGHPDLRRLLTDYGFIGHPFRKDFPLMGNVEVRYDPLKGRVVYEPVSIEPRTLVPRVIRDDNRYAPALKDAPKNG